MGMQNSWNCQVTITNQSPNVMMLTDFQCSEDSFWPIPPQGSIAANNSVSFELMGQVLPNSLGSGYLYYTCSGSATYSVEDSKGNTNQIQFTFNCNGTSNSADWNWTERITSTHPHPNLTATFNSVPATGKPIQPQYTVGSSS